MSKENPTLSQYNKLGYIENDGKLVKSETLVEKRVEKIEPTIIERMAPLVDQITKDQLKIKSIIGKSENKKVINATKTELDGIKFDSKLEAYMYSLLQGAGIGFERQKVYVLQEKFNYGGEAIRAITSRVDFYLPKHNIICDTKGYANDVSPIKFKMLKKLLMSNFENGYDKTLTKIEMPSTKKECDLLINRILFQKS